MLRAPEATEPPSSMEYAMDAKTTAISSVVYVPTLSDQVITPKDLLPENKSKQASGNRSGQEELLQNLQSVAEHVADDQQD